MPKEGRHRSMSFEARSRASPYPCSHRGSSSSSSHPQSEPHTPTAKDMKEWDEVRCPICMEHPHNAVVLLCSSSHKGCRPFMCDTSYRHSNCLDQYKKALSGSSSPEETGDQKPPSTLSCPLCRGGVTGWTVVEAARRYMNSKARSCSKESCGFSASYGELRKHARKEHPSVRPSEADPDRQRDWRRLEQRRDLGDLFSTIQWAMSGDDGDGVFGGLFDDDDDEDDEEISGGSRFRISPVAVFFIIRFSGLGAGSNENPISRVSVRSRRGRRTILWGETYGEPESADLVGSRNGTIFDDDDDEGEGDDADSDHAASRQGRGRPRRQLRLPDDDDDEDEMNDDDLL